MNRRSSASDTGSRIREAILVRGTDTETVANAAGMPVSDLEARLSNGELSMPEVVRVGGVLRMGPSDLFPGAAA